jgi:hypothetical protein
MKPIIINFPKIQDPRGNLTFCNILVKYLLWFKELLTYDMPGGEIRVDMRITNKKKLCLMSGADVVINNADGSIENFL